MSGSKFHYNKIPEYRDVARAATALPRVCSGPGPGCSCGVYPKDRAAFQEMFNAHVALEMLAEIESLVRGVRQGARGLKLLTDDCDRMQDERDYALQQLKDIREWFLAHGYAYPFRT